MKPRELGVLLLLAAIWGASFMFIKVAVLEMAPLTLVTGRMVLGVIGLVVLYALLGQRFAAPPAAEARPVRWRALIGPFVIAAVFNAVIPYLCLAWGETLIPSGNAAILNATTPLFTALLAYALGTRAAADRLPPGRLLGLLLGFVGVAVLVGGTSSGGTSDPTLIWLGHGAVLIMAASYGVASLYARHAFAGLPALVPALGQNVTAMLLLLPFALLFAPLTRVPSPAALASLLALGLGGTAIAYALYFYLLARVGATRTILVTYLLPITALIYGALLLAEPIHPQALLGMALILAGIAITTGGVAFVRRNVAMSNER